MTVSACAVRDAEGMVLVHGHVHVHAAAFLIDLGSAVLLERIIVGISSSQGMGGRKEQVLANTRHPDGILRFQPQPVRWIEHGGRSIRRRRSRGDR